MSNVFPLTDEQVEQRDNFVERILQATAGAFDIFTLYIGYELGFYRTLAEHGPMTSVDLAALTGTQERYVREWLEQQTVVGIINVGNHEAPPTQRCFQLPAAHAEVLVDVDSPNYVLPLAPMMAGVVRPISRLLNAFRTGGGVSYHEYGREFREGQGAINRVTFLQELGQAWLPAIPDLHQRLQARPAARVADIGCGVGWSAIGMAQAYPSINFDGFDLDAPSIELAKEKARKAKLNGRVSFYARDAAEIADAGEYDLVTALECIHDLSDPVSVLRTMRRLAGDKGTVLIADERVGDSFTPTGNDVEWMMYGWSVLHCLPVGMDDEHSAATGTVMRTDTLRQYAQAAGFRDVEVLPIDNFFFRVYRLVQ
jgi:ubiquinone/menaquinone biosynthesis C-methylase UbiE